MTQENTGAIADVLPLGPLQEGLLFHHALTGGDADVYGIQVRLELHGDADPARLRRSAAALLDRHPNLRAGFAHEELDRPVQFVPADTDLDWDSTDLTALHAGERAGVEERTAAAELDRGFDLAAPPLIRFHALGTGPARTVLLVTAHHVLLDGWSLPLLARDLLRLYAADGDAAALPPAPRYRDHLAWVGRLDHGAARRAWRTALTGLTGPTLVARAADGGAAGVPGEVGTPAAARTAPDRVERVLGAGAGGGLRALAATAGVSVNTVLQAAWALTLAVHTGRTDVVFGQPVSGRSPQLPGSQDMIGLFTNTLPIRVRLDPAESVSDLLTRLRMEQADLLDHQWTGLAEIQREAGHGTLFDTLLVVENYPFDPDAAGAGAGLRVGGLRVRDATHYPAALAVLPDEGPDRDTLLRLDHLPDSLSADTAHRLLDLFGHLLDQACLDPARPVSALDPLTAEQHATLNRHNDTTHPTAHTSLSTLLAEAETAHPDRVAVVDGDRELTHRELHADAARLAALLAEHGAGPETVVAVALPRGADLVTALLAAVRTGASYLPLDLDHPPARLADMAARAGAAVLVTTSGAHSGLCAGIAPLLLDAPETAARLSAAEPLPWAGVHPEQLVYTIFTSGSTGTPKGVGVSHRALANRLEWTQGAYGLTPEDRVAQKTPVGFDVSVWEFFWPLAVGAAIVTARPGGHRDPAYLAALFAEQRVTVCHFVPSMLRLFLDEPAAAGAAALRLVIASGEALDGLLARDFARVLDARLENLYGPTEAAVDVTSHLAVTPFPADAFDPTTLPGDARSTTAPTDPVPIGTPVWNTALHVLDPWLRPVPPGTAGELHLGGVQLARGYTGRPGLTAERFTADPFGPPGARLYRTGDLVRRRADGTVVYLGRSDDQVKVNGVRVEPGEVEAALSRLDGVSAAAVTVHTGPGGTARLTGYAVPAPGHTPDPADLRAHLAGALPAAMVPTVVVLLERLPLSVNGKLDRAALPAPEAPAPERGRPPRTGAEKVLCTAVADVLDLPEAAADADFFALGGDSITSVRLVGRALAEGLEITVRDVFALRTPEALAAHTESAPQAPPDPPDGPAPARGEEFADLLDAGDMDQLQRMWNSQD
ncbi:amino acid adenylation domain-containing protein [Nocardiopsis sp. NPDC058631]|uniref:non-ribosomal peptide synthetase n=1 Tax=Nocardiopsis sp. NPDC058631 TaxID=3346566 RepID=UPI0036622CC9